MVVQAMAIRGLQDPGSSGHHLTGGSSQPRMTQSLDQPAGRLRATHGEGPLRVSRPGSGSFATINLLTDSVRALGVFARALYTWPS
jgi:hypothetical protein